MNKNDLTGMRFGKLVVIRPTEQRDQKSIVWECRCDCGTATSASAVKLLSGRKKSCGCLRGESASRKAADITGQRFGRLTAIRPTGQHSGNSIVWECRCDCGNTAAYSVSFLRSKAKSCGCLRRENCQKQMHNAAGITYGRLTGIAPTAKRGPDRSVIWQWQCTCGKITEKSINDVSTGAVQSCGCMREKLGPEVYARGLKPGYILGTNLHMLRQEETKLRSNNVSGVKGVYYLSKENKWAASIKFQGVKIYKRYPTFEEAVEARRKMRAVHEEFLEWWDSLSDEEKQAASAAFEQEKGAQAALLKKRISEII